MRVDVLSLKMKNISSSKTSSYEVVLSIYFKTSELPEKTGSKEKSQRRADSRSVGSFPASSLVQKYGTYAVMINYESQILRNSIGLLQRFGTNGRPRKGMQSRDASSFIPPSSCCCVAAFPSNSTSAELSSIFSYPRYISPHLHLLKRHRHASVELRNQVERFEDRSSQVLAQISLLAVFSNPRHLILGSLPTCTEEGQERERGSRFRKVAKTRVPIVD